MIKKALITGITGQDGSYLAELLLEKGYEVHGLIRGSNLTNISHIKENITLHQGDLKDYSFILRIIEKIKPEEVYHLAGKSFVYEPLDESFDTFEINIGGTLNLFSALKKKSPFSKIYFAGTSEIFGKVKESPQNEDTRFNPRSPYGISKLAGYEIVKNYRESYGLFACTGLLFNHESPRRGAEFITKKITKKIKEINNKKTNVLVIGNLDARRDWGYSKDYVRAMWLMLQQEKPEDFVVGTGETHSVREMVQYFFKKLNLDYEIIDLHKKTSKEADRTISELMKRKGIFVVQHPSFYRPSEEELLVSNPKKIKKELGWIPETSFEKLLDIMLDEELKESTLK